jgi:uncharacterized protein YecE (DUF72 family)
MPNLSLFSEPDEVTTRDRLAASLRGLAERDVWVGTSSWKYPGWLGSIYAPERYTTRGRFSKKRFEETCLGEYAETFPIVCGDFAFYQFPLEAYWQKLFDATPTAFRFAFKVPEEITVKRWPGHARYGARAGAVNDSFLNAELLDRLFLRPLAQFGERTALLILELGTFSKTDFESVAQFSEALDRFLSRLPRQCRYAIEVRNREYLVPEYFQCLRNRGVAHVFNAWTRMPELAEQIANSESFTADFTVVRALLRAGRTYEQAVAQFAPYEKTQDPNPSGRDAIRSIIEQAMEARGASYVFVNNRFEGNAPSTIEAIVAPDAGESD